MKKLIYLMACLTTLMVLVSCGNSIDFSYIESNEGTIIISKYIGKEKKDIVVPSKIKGKLVSEIGNEAFKNLYYIKSIKLPDTITVIGEQAFYGCVFTSVNLPKNLSKISEAAFKEQHGLQEIILPDSLTEIGKEAFSLCSITKIKLSANIQTIGENAFSESGLTTVSIPGSYKKIDNKVFMNCKALKELIIEDGVEEIGDYSFNGCTKLETFNFPASLVKIGRSAFQDCKSITTLEIPETIKEIDAYAFAYCGSLTYLKLDEKSRTPNLGPYAFAYCGALEKVHFGGGKFYKSTFHGNLKMLPDDYDQQDAGDKKEMKDAMKILTGPVNQDKQIAY